MRTKVHMIATLIPPLSNNSSVRLSRGGELPQDVFVINTKVSLNFEDENFPNLSADDLERTGHPTSSPSIKHDWMEQNLGSYFDDLLEKITIRLFSELGETFSGWTLSRITFYLTLPDENFGIPGLSGSFEPGTQIT